MKLLPGDSYQDVGGDRRQQLDLDAQAIEPACPIMCRAAGFHHHQANRTIQKPALELAADEAVGFAHGPACIGHGHLENALGQIDPDNVGIGFGPVVASMSSFLWLIADTPHHMRPAGTMMPRKSRGSPSHQSSGLLRSRSIPTLGLNDA